MSGEECFCRRRWRLLEGDVEGVLRPESDCFEREVDEGLEFIYSNS